MEVFVGTGGFSNEDWVGLFYPQALKKTEWLEFYSREFNAVEINSTFYAVPGQKTMQSMLERSLGRLRFAVKLHQSFSHERSADAEAAKRFLFTVEPLRGAGKLGTLLAQFPYSFKNVPENRAWLARLAEWFVGVPVAVEFRHASWDREPARAYLVDLGLLPVSLDLPRLEGLPAPRLETVKGQAYLRMHGRNSKWFDAADAAARHDYLYTEAELAPWAEAVHKSGADEIFIFFQNTTRGQGLENARMLKQLLSNEG